MKQTYTKEDGKELILSELTPGEKRSGFFSFLDGGAVMPAAVIQGNKVGKTVLITAGIHAKEYVGIQAVLELAAQISPENVTGRIIMVKAVCREALEQREGSILRQDGRNLNREFPGRADGTFTQRLAWEMEQKLFAEADYYIDLHSGDSYEELVPYTYYPGKAAPEVSRTARRMACCTDVPYMVRSESTRGGAYSCAASAGIPGVLLKRGGMGRWTAEEVQSMKKDVCAILDELGILKSHDVSRTYFPLEVTQVQYQAASGFGFWYPKKKPGDLVRSGDVLGSVRGYDGKIRETAVAEIDGVILYQTGSLQVVEDGAMIAYGKINYHLDTRKEEITNYWTKRSEGFLEQRRQELHSPLAQRFDGLLRRQLPGEHLRILDVGCGTGFFTILLSRAGHETIGVDLTPDMVRGAQKLAMEEGADCEFRVMDAENLDFPDGSFDAVVSRNLTWTLPDVQRAYREWSRVLKPGGVIINIDANYGDCDFTDTSELPENHAHNRIEREMMQECERIKRQLPISSCVRPGWDVGALAGAGMASFSVDLKISRELYRERDDFYNPTPLFLICARKDNGI